VHFGETLGGYRENSGCFRESFLDFLRFWGVGFVIWVGDLVYLRFLRVFLGGKRGKSGRRMGQAL
jgi:hypothetical protein